ncbi:hypothetical protein CABS01_11250 [Colletotrichum abscissum]|uniref:uncharacterized protein n=1 Tax=Colletotrichum abscissum TaxID=1671311 RepID=UPI0027D7529A|nr:uncharacterized protein CABS01_11250 [Colletotrichum abscissum]KAK1495022.1 hypothetical protein CABS01_11250 [Colletotrichum abscissum]
MNASIPQQLCKSSRFTVPVLILFHVPQSPQCVGCGHACGVGDLLHSRCSQDRPYDVISLLVFFRLWIGIQSD